MVLNQTNILQCWEKQKSFFQQGKIKANGSIANTFPEGNPVVVEISDTYTAKTLQKDATYTARETCL